MKQGENRRELNLSAPQGRVLIRLSEFDAVAFRIGYYGTVSPVGLHCGRDKGTTRVLGHGDRSVHGGDAEPESRGDGDWEVAQGMELENDFAKFRGEMRRSVAVLFGLELDS